MSKIPVLITRTQPGADQTAKGVAALGLEPIVSPALTLQADPGVEPPAVEGFSGLIFTSANGVKYYSERVEDRSLTAWCVGPATATAAREAGFEQVEESSGNAKQLAAFIASTIAPPSKPLLHVANAAAKGDLSRELKMRRYKVVFLPLYKANTSPDLVKAADKVLLAKKPAILLVHSAKGAAAFIELTEGQELSGLTPVVISRPAARPLEQAGMEVIHIADRPNERALMKTLKDVAATLST